MKVLRSVSFALLALFVAASSWAQAPKPGPVKHGIRKHALVRVGLAVAAAPKITAVGLKDTVGGILFTTEAAVDVVHGVTTVLMDGTNAPGRIVPFGVPFAYLDRGVGYVDTGLEAAYSFFFKLQI
jgi:hypothetical protein